VGDPARHLHALERAAGEAQRALEAAIAQADASWSDQARRVFESEHLAGIRSAARLLRTDLSAVASLADTAAREIST
jgi:hypothetical protein